MMSIQIPPYIVEWHHSPELSLPILWSGGVFKQSYPYPFSGLVAFLSRVTLTHSLVWWPFLAELTLPILRSGGIVKQIYPFPLSGLVALLRQIFKDEDIIYILWLR